MAASRPGQQRNVTREQLRRTRPRPGRDRTTGRATAFLHRVHHGVYAVGRPPRDARSKGRRGRPRLWRRRGPQPRLSDGALGILEALAGLLRSNRPRRPPAPRDDRPPLAHARAPGRHAPTSGSAPPARPAPCFDCAPTARRRHPGANSQQCPALALPHALPTGRVPRPATRTGAFSRSWKPPTARPARSSRTRSSPSASATASRARRSTRSSPAARWTRTSRPNA